ncbi:hypothetical protein HK102_003803, partial [Quaeritorhiza haematococci]
MATKAKAVGRPAGATAIKTSSNIALPFLPDHVLIQIARFLSIPDLFLLFQTCSRLRSFYKDGPSFGSSFAIPQDVQAAVQSGLLSRNNATNNPTATPATINSQQQHPTAPPKPIPPVFWERLRSVKDLTLAFCTILTDNDVNRLATTLNTLRTLNIDACPLLTQASVVSVAEAKLKDLENLSFTIPALGLQCIVRLDINSPNLRVVRMPRYGFVDVLETLKGTVLKDIQFLYHISLEEIRARLDGFIEAHAQKERVSSDAPNGGSQETTRVLMDVDRDGGAGNTQLQGGNSNNGLESDLNWDTFFYAPFITTTAVLSSEEEPPPPSAAVKNSLNFMNMALSDQNQDSADLNRLLQCLRIRTKISGGKRDLHFSRALRFALGLGNSHAVSLLISGSGQDSRIDPAAFHMFLNSLTHWTRSTLDTILNTLNKHPKDRALWRYKHPQTGDTYLHIAARKVNPKSKDCLLGEEDRQRLRQVLWRFVMKYPVSLMLPNKQGKTPMRIAYESQSALIVQHLLDEDVPPCPELRKLLVGCIRGEMDVVQSVITDEDFDRLFDATEEPVRTILSEELSTVTLSDLSSRWFHIMIILEKFTLAHLASRHTALAEWLLGRIKNTKAKATVTLQGRNASPLSIADLALFLDAWDTARFALARGSPLSANMLLAALLRSIPAAKQQPITQQKATITQIETFLNSLSISNLVGIHNTVTPSQPSSPLGHVLYSWNIARPLLLKLLEHPSLHTDRKDTDGNTLLHLATKKLDLPVLTLLHIHHKQASTTCLSIQNNHGETPLHILCKVIPMTSLVEHQSFVKTNFPIINFFVMEGGEALRAVDRTGRTPLAICHVRDVALYGDVAKGASMFTEMLGRRYWNLGKVGGESSASSAASATSATGTSADAGAGVKTPVAAKSTSSSPSTTPVVGASSTPTTPPSSSSSPPPVQKDPTRTAFHIMALG